MRDRRRQRPVARAAPVAYYVSIPRRTGRSQLLATISTHITINGVRLPLDRPRTVLSSDDVVIDTVIQAGTLAHRQALLDAVVRGVGGTVIVGTENGLEAYTTRDFEPTPSGGKIG